MGKSARCTDMTLFQHHIQIRRFIIPRTWIQRLRTNWLYSLAVLTGSVNWCPCGRIESWVDALCGTRQPRGSGGWSWWWVISRQAAWTSSCLPQYPEAHPSSSGCNRPCENNYFCGVTGVHCCATLPSPPQGDHSSCTAVQLLNTASRALFLAKVGNLQNSFTLQIYFSPQNIKWRWEAHCLAIISQGCSPLSATELCLICLGRCWRGTRGRLMFMCSGMWNHKTVSLNTCISPKLQLLFFSKM